MKIRFFLAWVIAAALPSLCQLHAEATAQSPVWPVEELGHLPMLYREKNELDEATLHRLNPDLQTATINGEKFLGFKFWTTIRNGGDSEWLVASSVADPVPLPWKIIDADGKEIGLAEPHIRSLETHSRIVERFPGTASITYYRIPKESLEAEKQYWVIRPTDNQSQARYAISIAIDSELGKKNNGVLNRPGEPTPELKTADHAVGEMLEIRWEQGEAAACAFLTQELDRRFDRWEWEHRVKGPLRDELFWYAWQSLHSSAYRESQLGGGRVDKYWASCIYDTLFTTELRRRYFCRVFDVAPEVISNMNAANRYGRAREILNQWAELMRVSGYNLDPTTYPDRGAAFPFLPVIRNREIPALVPLANVKWRTKSLPEEFDYKIASAFSKYSWSLWSSGRWREALEWQVWRLNWSSESPGGDDPQRQNAWHGALEDLASCMSNLELHEEALTLCERSLAAENDGGYHGRWRILFKAKRLEQLMRLGKEIPDLVEQFEQLSVQAKGHMYLDEFTYLGMRTDLAKALIYTGRQAEGEQLFDELVALGHHEARAERLVHWVKTGRVEGVEQECIAILNQIRESDNKMGEIWLYSLYADFLESQGRFREALQIRREAIRLCRTFDLFTKLPRELAKLAALLQLTGNVADAELAASEASGLLENASLPERIVSSIRDTLDGMKKSAPPANETRKRPNVEFQPVSSIVVPLEAMPWTMFVTLANPGQRDAHGVLSVDGLPAKISLAEAGPSDVDVVFLNEGVSNDLPLRVEAGSYQRIAVTAQDGVEGAVTFSWVADEGDAVAESKLVIDSKEEGVGSALIEAGSYQDNPFYGVPIHHQYLSANPAAESLPLRFITSASARVEIYNLEGELLAIDAQGNGSLQDRGDELHANSDGKGNLKLELANQSGLFMILLYPRDPLAEEGLSLRIEAQNDEEWLLYSEDRLNP